MRFSEFQEKEVINACDCCKLGYVEDLVIDEKKGKLKQSLYQKGGESVIFSVRMENTSFHLPVLNGLDRILF